MKKLLLLNFLLFITLSVFSQNIQLQGVVVGQGNEPLPGVNVVVKGTTNGTITNNEGQFSINVPSTGILVISYVGYKTQEVPVNGKNYLHIVLEENLQSLDEVVVIGYGVQKKSVVTAAISKVTSEDLNSVKPSRVEDIAERKNLRRADYPKFRPTRI